MAHKVVSNSASGYVLLPIHVAYALVEKIDASSAQRFLEEWVYTDDVANSDNPFQKDLERLREKFKEELDPALLSRMQVIAEEDKLLMVLWEWAESEVRCVNEEI